jgi:hypothetical protein
MSRQSEQRHCLDGDYGPQVDHGFGVAGQDIELALDRLCVLVSSFHTQQKWDV